jgi:urea transport system substrate-binding protein
MLPNHHITKPVFIGEIQANGQFNVVWKTPDLVPGKAWSPYVAETRNLIGDWTKPIECGNYDTVTKKCVGTKHA